MIMCDQALHWRVTMTNLNRPMIGGTIRADVRATERDIKTRFGLGPKAKWPAEGMPARTLDGVQVWVLSKEAARLRERFHRAECFCPHCGKTMSVGRWHQHREFPCRDPNTGELS